jgi:hypothetical protein
MVWPPQNTDHFGYAAVCCGPLKIEPDTPYAINNSAGSGWDVPTITFHPRDAWGPVTFVSVAVEFSSSGFTYTLTHTSEFVFVLHITPPAPGFPPGIDYSPPFTSSDVMASPVTGYVLATYVDQRGVNSTGAFMFGGIFNSPDYSCPPLSGPYTGTGDTSGNVTSNTVTGTTFNAVDTITTNLSTFLATTELYLPDTGRINLRFAISPPPASGTEYAPGTPLSMIYSAYGFDYGEIMYGLAYIACQFQLGSLDGFPYYVYAGSQIVPLTFDMIGGVQVCGKGASIPSPPPPPPPPCCC